MRKLNFLLLCTLFTAAFCFTSCDQEGDLDSEDQEENNQQNQDDDKSNQNSEIIEFYNRFPGNDLGVDTATWSIKGYDKLVAAIPAGIYFYTNAAGDEKILAIGTDKSILLFNPAALEKETAYIGNTCWYNCYGDDGKKSGYIFYNDMYGESNDFKPAPTACEYEFESRNDFMKLMSGTEISYQLMENLKECFAPVNTSLTYAPGCKVHNGGKTRIAGVECNYYYISYDTPAQAAMGSDVAAKWQEFWVTDNYICLQQVSFQQDTISMMKSFTNGGDMAYNYEKIAEMFNIHGKYALDETLRCHMKYGNYWLSDEYPEILNDWLVKYDGEISSFEISRRAWMGFDHICTITFTVDDATPDEVRAYIRKVLALNLSNVDSEVDQDVAGKAFIHYSINNADGTPVSLGGVSIYPAYEIDYIEGTTFTVTFDLVRLFGV